MSFSPTFEPTFVPTLAPTGYISNNVTVDVVKELIEELLPAGIFLVFCISGCLCLIIGSICASWCCYPCRFRFVEVFEPKPAVKTLRTCEAVGMGTATLGATILLTESYMLSWEFGTVVFAFYLVIGGCCIFIFYKEAVTYEEMGPDAKVVSSLGYQNFYDPPYPPQKAPLFEYSPQDQAERGYQKESDHLLSRNA